jgi:hypothetical protein
MKIRTFVKRKKMALKTASPRTRDKLRHEYKVALICQLLAKGRAA